MLAAVCIASILATDVSGSQRDGSKSVSDISDPRWFGMRIADEASIIDFKSSLAIGREIRSIEWNVRGSQIVVVTVDRVRGQTPKAFATQLFNHWRIGSAEHNNGVLVLVVKGERRVEIEPGIGLNRLLSQSWCTSMLGEHVVPEFRRGQYGDGLLAAVERIGERMRRGDKMVSSIGKIARKVGFYSLLAFGPTAAVAAWGAHTDRSARQCPSCSAIVEHPQICQWETTLPATHLMDGLRQARFTCQACGYTGLFSSSIRRYDGRRQRRDGTWDYYYRDTDRESSWSSNSGGSSSGGGGGASW